jgi:hypothetical protein
LERLRRDFHGKAGPTPPSWPGSPFGLAPGVPDRIIPKPGHAAEIKKRTLTNLYNQSPAWLGMGRRETRARETAYPSDWCLSGRAWR